MRQWLAAALAVAVAACAAPSRPTLGAAPDMDAALDARLFPPYYGSVPVQLSKPAYVALFEVIPGRGAALLYPQAGTGFQQVTESWVPVRYSASRWLYDGEGVPGRYGYRPTGFASGWDTYRGFDAYGFARPRYLFLVASEEPLAVEQFQDDPASIRRYLGAAQYAAWEPYEAMERLAYAMLPFARADSWVMDVFVDWGYDWGHGAGPGMTAAQASYWPVVCGQAGFQYVTWVRYVSGWGFANAPCPGASVVAPPGAPGVPLPPRDSTEIPAAGEGRDRTVTPDEAGRRRAGVSATMEQVIDDDAARVRQRIALLRDDASRAGFEDALADRLRRDVQVRQRAAALRGHTQPAHLAGSDGPRIAADDVAGRERAARRTRAGGAPAYRPGTLGSSPQALPRTRAPSAGSATSGGSSVRRAGQAERTRTGAGRPTADPSSSSTGSSGAGSSSSGSSSSGSSSSGSSGGRSRTTPPPA